jgi:hypothetical protein
MTFMTLSNGMRAHQCHRLLYRQSQSLYKDIQDMIFALGGVWEATAWWDFSLVCVVNTSWFPWNVGTSHLLNSNTACESDKKWGVTEIFSLLHIYVLKKNFLYYLRV